MKCICCESCEFEVFSKNSWLNTPVNRCKKCGLLITGESLEKLENTLKEYYTKNITNEELERTINSNFQSNHGKYITNQTKSMIEYTRKKFTGKKFLDIGPGPGISLILLEDMGFKVMAVEQNKNCVEFINKKLKNGRIIQGFFDDVNIKEKFDLIWISHALEHMPRPDEILKKCKNLLEKDGIIFVAVPNCENPKILWDSINENASSFHYSKNTITMIGKHADLKVVSIDTFRELYRFESRFHSILEKYLKKINRILCPYYPFKKSSGKKSHEIRVIFRNT